MYYRDHNPPHIHASYQGYEASVAIEDARVLRGKLPPTVMLISEAMGYIAARGVAGKLVACAHARAAREDCGAG